MHCLLSVNEEAVGYDVLLHCEPSFLSTDLHTRASIKHSKFMLCIIKDENKFVFSKLFWFN